MGETEFTLGRCPSNVQELIDEAVHTCVLYYNERVDKGEGEAGGLDDAIAVRKGDSVTFIRLAMLSGRKGTGLMRR